MTADSGKVTLMDRARIERTVKRIAYQIAEKVKDKRICLIGLNERGYAVAKELSERLEKACSNELTLLGMNVSHARTRAAEIRQEHPFDDSVVLIVDDVMFSGKTMFTALQYLFDRPDYTVYTAVLVDRGHRTLPIASEFVGMEIPTKPKEHVEMTLEDGLAHEVFLYRK